VKNIINQKTLPEFQKRFVAFHDARFLSIHYDLDAGTEDKYMHRLTIKISTPDWSIKSTPPPPKRITLVLEIEGVIDYILLRKPEIFSIAIIREIDVILVDGKVMLNFLPLYDEHPMRRVPNIHKFLENNMNNDDPIFIVAGKKCFWSIEEE